MAKINIRNRYTLFGATALAAIAAGIGAVRLMAQTPPDPTAPPPAPVAPGSSTAPAVTPGNPLASPDTPRGPKDPIPFSEAPTGDVKLIRRPAGDGTFREFYSFTSKSARTYMVEIPVELTRENRSVDDWVNLFAAYGRDPRAEANIGAVRGAGLISDYDRWMASRISDQAAKITGPKNIIAQRTGTISRWSLVHRDAKTQNNRLKAQEAWSVIAAAKSDLKAALPRLAREKLELGHLYKEYGNYAQASQQYREVIALEIFPYSAEAVAKLRVIDGATVAPAEFPPTSQVALEWIGQSNLYQSAVRALLTTP